MMIRSLVAAPIALVLAGAFVTAAAYAAPVTVCTTTPAQLRAAAVSADPAAQAKALSLVTTGEKLCKVDAREEAAKKFAAAARALGTDLAALPTMTASQ